MTKKLRPGSPKSFTIGIDLGGTKVLAALIDGEGRVVRETRRVTVPPGMGDHDPSKGSQVLSPAEVRKHIAYVISSMGDATVEALGDARKSLVGIGLASAGPMNIEKGTLDYPSNFMGWKVVPIVKLLEEDLRSRGLKFPVVFQNDAIAAALGEGWIGRAQGCKTFASVTVGTGIGTGVIFNGQPLQSRGMGSEWGHMIANAAGLSRDPDSFNDREVEGMASGANLLRRARARGFHGATTSDLAQAAQNGDELATELFAGCSDALASLFYSLSLGLHPEKFVVSGGMLGIKELFLPRAMTLYKEMMTKKNPKFVAPIQIAKLGTKAGVIGAAYLPYMTANSRL